MASPKPEACLPPRLHWFSRQVYDLYRSGEMNTAEFRRWFHMPNSDYLAYTECIVEAVAAAAPVLPVLPPGPRKT